MDRVRQGCLASSQTGNGIEESSDERPQKAHLFQTVVLSKIAPGEGGWTRRGTLKIHWSHE